MIQNIHFTRIQEVLISYHKDPHHGGGRTNHSAESLGGGGADLRHNRNNVN